MSATDRITAIVTDFGGVLTTSLRDCFLAVEDATGVSPRNWVGALHGLTEQRGINPLFELERGQITEAHFLEALATELSRMLGRTVSLDGFTDTFLGNLHPNPRMIEYMLALRSRGYRMALCTNNVREWEPHWRPKLPVDEIFDVVVDSAFVGTRKPEPDIYALTLDRLGVPAQSALFIDDMEVNCDAARALGMSAVRFSETDQALADIEAALASAPLR